MKSKYLAAAAALLCAAGLAACGGSGNGSMSLGVQVYGIDRSGLVLQNNGGDDLAITSYVSTTWFFKTLMAPDTAFKVTIKDTPTGVTCEIANNTGKINYYSYNQTVVTCTPVRYALGGSVVGLKADGLVLANGSMTVGVTASNPSWEFLGKIGNGSLYGVTVLNHPTGQTCSVANGTGTMPQANVSNVVVTCI